MLPDDEPVSRALVMDLRERIIALEERLARVEEDRDRLHGAFQKVASAYPCGTLDSMLRAARDAIPPSLR